MADITLHIDELLDGEHRAALVDKVRHCSGVENVLVRDDKPHLMVVDYDPQQVVSTEILELVEGQGVHAELIGL